MTCRHFVRQRCGGCAYLHVPYATQVAEKRGHVEAVLRDALRAIPNNERPDIKGLVKPTVPSPQVMGHRASAKLCLHEDRGGQKTFGLYQQGSNIVIDTRDCPANVPLANAIAARLFANEAELPAKFYNHQDGAFQRGRFKFATIRTSPSGAGTLQDAAVTLSHTGVDRAAMSGWLSRIGLAELCVYESQLTKDSGDNIMGRDIAHVSGPATFCYRLGQENFAISPVSFFQANHGLAPALIAAATAFEEDGDVLLDLYGGFGAYSFHARHKFKEAVVVDGNKAAIAALKQHAQKLGAPVIVGIADSCEHYLMSVMPHEIASRVTHIIANPSRTGLSSDVRRRLTVETFPSLKAIHYVSCNPATFARDAAELTHAGFSLASVQPFDMFPNADHIEVVGVFRSLSSR